MGGPVILLLLALAFPLPCATESNCWLQWDPAPGAERYEILSGSVVCDVLTGFVDRKGKLHPPRFRWWPRSTTACPLAQGQVRAYSERACNSAECGGESLPVEWIGQPMICFRGGCEEPCYPGAPRQAPWAKECQQ